MDSPRGNGKISDLGESSKRIARGLLAIGENRIELFMVELQEERERLIIAAMLVLAMAFFGLLGCITLTFMIVVLLWDYSPIGALLVLTCIYGGLSIFFYRRLMELQRDWQSFSGTLDQLRKDRQCLQRRLD